MPRQADPYLETRIVTAAHRLWRKGGEDTLTMRAVAKAAGTNTPAVYRRFKDREAIVRALVRETQRELRARLEPCRSLQEIAHAVLEFALQRRREYALLTGGLMSISETRPNLEFVLQRSAEWLGGSPSDHLNLVLGVWALIHGTATLIISKTLPPGHEKQMHAAFSSAVERLLAEASARGKH
jgi:AcrR family transcriptional regulator